jgi:hypothetical protein
MPANAAQHQRILSLILFAGILIAGNIFAFKIVHVPSQMQFVVLIGLVMFYPILRYPIVGVYLIFIFLPFIPLIRRLYYLSYTRPDADPLIIVGDLIIFIMVLGLFFTFREHIQQGTFRQKIALVILAYFLYMVLRTFVYNELPLKMALQRFRFYGPQVLLFFVGMLYAFEEKHLRRLWGITIVIGIVAVGYGLKQSFFGYSEAEKIWFSSIDFTSLFIKGIARPFSFFSSPAAFADYMQLAVIGIIVVTGWGAVAGRMSWLLLPLFWTGALITSVRSNWIGMALSLFLWLFIVRVKGLRQRFIFMGILIAAFLLFDVFEAVVQTGLGVGSFVATASGNQQANQTLTMLVTERTNAISNPFQEYSLLSRIALWKLIFQMSSDLQLALLGRGVGALNADSLYITYLSEFGYPGMILIIAIFFIFIKYGFTVIDRSRSAHAVIIAKAVVTMDIVFGIISMTGSHVHAFPGDTYFWFWNGVLVSLWSQLTKEPHEAAVDA